MLTFPSHIKNLAATATNLGKNQMKGHNPGKVNAVLLRSLNQ